MSIKQKVKKIMVNIKECININDPANPGIFVRGDGARYREWMYIDSKKDTDIVWDKMLKSNPSKTFKISGEFRSRGYRPGMILGGILFVKYTNNIEFGDVSRLRNTSVWHTK